MIWEGCEAEDILSYMIANKCGTIRDEHDITHAEFDLHCATMKVAAEFVGNWETGDIRYKIVAASMEVN